MATIQDVFSHIYTTEAHLGDVAVKNGQIILCVDSEKLYIDHGTTRVSTSDVVYVENEAALPLAPLDKFYITQDTGDIFFYLNGEWKKLNDTFRDYTAFEVYANDTIISPGEHAELGTITVEIPVQMTETFALRTTTPEADSDVVIDWGDGTVQKVKDGEHGGYTGPDGEGRYIAKMTHTYAATGKYVVKVYGKDYFCLSHAPSHVSDASNMQCRILADDLPIASHLTNLTAFAYGTLKLVTVQCASYKYLHRTTNHAQMFTNDKNLLSVTGFEDLVMISRGAEGCFQFCENMHTCDFNGVLCSNNPRAMYAMFQNCYALSVDIGKFFPTKFVSRALNFTNTFTHMHAMTGTVNAKQLWGDPTIDWQDYNNCFYGCPEEIRAQVPTAWGGTASDPVAYELTVDSITLKGHAANTANGLVILNAQGKVDNTMLPDTSIDLSNYSQNSSIKLTSTAGAVDLISNTMEVALYSGTAHVKANVDSVELQGTNLKFNNNAQNTAGGIVVVDTDTGKVPSSVLPEMGIDLTNYVTEENISLNAAGVASNATYKASSVMRIEGGTYTNIDTTAGPLNLGTSTSDVFLGGVGSNRNVTIQVTSISNLKLATGTNMDGSSANTANGFAIVGDDGKLPSSIIPESTGGTVDLTDYVGTGNISLTTGKENLLTLKADTMMEGYESTFKLGTGASAAGGNGAYLELNGGSFGVTGYGAYFGSTNSQMSIFQINAQTLMYNNAEQNQPNGLVVLGSDGKIPSGLYDVGSSTVDLSNYTTSDAISLSADSGITLQTLGTSFYMNGSGANITMTDPLLSLSLNNHLPNTAGGFVIVPDDGKLPSSILPESTGSSVDLSAYTGGINLNSTNDSAVAIKFNSGNSTYNAALTMDAAGVTLSGYGDVTLSHTGGSYLRLTSGEATLSSNSSLSLRASSRLTIYATEGIYLGGAGFNTAGGLVTVGEDGKISSSLYNAGSSGATPPLLLTCPTSSTAVHLEITAGKLADGSDNATLINTSTSAEHRAKVYGNSGNTDWIECPETGFGTNFNGWPIRVDVTDLLDPSEISYIRYRWVSTTGDASDWYAMVYPCATEAPVASGSGSGGDTSALEKRVTTLETTVGTLNASVDEILADYGEGSGALVYRVVASATEPENPTEGMIWIQTE